MAETQRNKLAKVKSALKTLPKAESLKKLSPKTSKIQNNGKKQVATMAESQKSKKTLTEITKINTDKNPFPKVIQRSKKSLTRSLSKKKIDKILPTLQKPPLPEKK